MKEHKKIKTGKMVGLEKSDHVLNSGNKVKKNRFLGFAESFIQYFQMIFILSLVILILAFAYCVYNVYDVNINEMKLIVQQKQQVLAEKENELSELKSAKVNYEGIEESVQKMLMVLPSEKELSSIFVQLDALAYKNNLSLDTVDIAESQELDGENIKSQKPTLKKLALTLSLTGGDYYTLKNFLIDVEKNLRLLDVKALIYEPLAGSYNLTMNTYYWGENIYEESDEE
ncbi:type 4a pilus biogenesis protein PilO [Candidatus Kuenenbacteria bacterium]|nr:type 4a pilus biogenesis protein PilO [Candidatus Kuenenbacteria bacterium]